jgi:uncharacterized protein
MTRVNRGVLTLVVLLAAAALGYIYMSSTATIVRQVRVAAGPRTDEAYTLLQEIAEVVARHDPSIRLELIETSDSSENVTLVRNGGADLAAIRSDTPSAVTARLIAVLFRDYFQIITRADANIRRISDLRGKRIAVPPAGTSSQRNFWTIADHYDLPVRGIDWRAMPVEAAYRQMATGEIDAIFIVSSSRDAGVLKMIADTQESGQPPAFRFVPIDQVPAMVLKRPFLESGTIVKGSFFGNPPLPARDLSTLTVQRYLIANEDVDASLIADITRIIFEQRLDLIVRMPLAAQITAPNILEGPALPLHPGAAQYFSRNEPSFIQENAEPIALGVTILAMLVSGLLALRSRMLANRKNRADHYNLDLLAIGKRARGATRMSEINTCRDDLAAVLEQMVTDLDTDAVTEEGFQSFALTYQAAHDVISDASLNLSNRI